MMLFSCQANLFILLQMGFSKSKISGVVDTDKVYHAGRQWIGPANTFKIFSATGHVLHLEDISVFAIADKVQVCSTHNMLIFIISVNI